MDNGHTDTNQPTATQDYLFAQGLNEGAGTEDVNANNVEAENNLDTTNQDAHWNNPSGADPSVVDLPMPENTPQNRHLDLGNNAMKTLETVISQGEQPSTTTEQPSTTPEQPSTAPEQPSTTPEQPPEQEQVTNLVMPPGMEPPAPEAEQESESTLSASPSAPQENPDYIKITEHLNEAGIKATEHAISDFQQSGDATGLVERVNNLREEAIASLEGGKK